MRTLDKRPVLRWIAPAAALAVVGAGFLVGQNAVADPTLPKLTAEQLVAKASQARVDHLSGTVRESAELGLPELPVSQGQDSTDFTALLSGTHDLKVWSSGEDKSRVMMSGQFGESDLVRNGSDVWAWNQREKKATHLKLPSASAKPEQAPTQPPTTPEEAAKKALGAIDDSTTVELASNVTVAGQSSYVLVLTPKDTDSTVGSVQIAVDGTTFLPLRVEAFAKGADQPAFSVGYTDISYKAVDDSVFAFSPPEGTKVTTKSVPAPGEHKSSAKTKAERKAEAERAKSEFAKNVTTVGDGWTEVVVAKTGAELFGGSAPSTGGRGGGQADQWQQVLNSLPTASGKGWTGHVWKGTLFSVVLTDDGRVAAGAVAPERLYSALG